MAAGSAHSCCPANLNANVLFCTCRAEKTLRGYPSHRWTNEETETQERSRPTGNVTTSHGAQLLFPEILSPGYSGVTRVLQTHRPSCLPRLQMVTDKFLQLHLSKHNSRCYPPTQTPSSPSLPGLSELPSSPGPNTQESS